MKSAQQQLDKLQLIGSPKVVIPPKIVEEIKYLCKAHPRLEWSGVLFYKVKGNISNVAKPDKVSFEVKAIFLMDIGSSTYTEFNWTEEIMEFVLKQPDGETWLMGHVHSHNTMDVFFSGTDVSELNDNCTNHNIYLSLIVNNFLDMEARLAFAAKPTTFLAKDQDGKDYRLSITSDVMKPIMFYYKCEVIYKRPHIDVPPEFAKRLEEVEAQVQKRKLKEKADLEAAKSKVYNGYDRSKSMTPVHSNPNKLSNKGKSIPNYRNWADDLSDWENISSNDLESSLNNIEEDTLEEQFLNFVIRLGNPIEDDSLDDSLDDVKLACDNKGIDMPMYFNTIIENYGIYYDQFFDAKPKFKGDQAFLEMLDAVIETMIYREPEYAFLGNLIDRLRALGNKYEASISKTEPIV